MKILIKNDVFNIFKRIKQINNNYFIIFNKLKNKYEIHDNFGIVFSLPFNVLDERCLTYVRKMLKSSNEDILKDIELTNQKIEKENNEKIILECIKSAEKNLRRR